MENERKIPCLRFRGFIEAWEQRKFSEVFDFLQNNALSRAELSDAEGKIMNVHYGDILVKYGEVLDVKRDELTYLLNDSLVKKYQASILQNGDIIIADAAEDETVGKCSEIAGLTEETVLSGLHTIPCRPKKQFAEGFLGYYINSNAYHDQLFPLIQGTKISSISKSALQDTVIMYPKLKSEQKQIGESFSSLDDLITLHQRKYDKFVATKKALIEKIFPKKASKVPQLRFKGYESPWKNKTLGQAGATYTGLSGKTKEDFGHGEARFVTYVNVFKNPIADVKGVDFVEIDDTQNVVKSGDVLFTTSSETPEEVGMSSVWLGDTQNIYLNSFCFGYRLFSSEKIDPLYLAYLLRSPGIRKEFQFLAQGISRYNISKTKVMDIEISVPEDYEEQVKIGKLFFNLDKLIELTQKKYEKLENLKKAMLNKMFV